MIPLKINNSPTSFEGVYFSKVKQGQLTHNEKVALGLLGEEIMHQDSLSDYDFTFGKINDTSKGKDIFVKVDLECSKDNFRLVRLPIKSDYKTIQSSIESLKQAVHSIKSKNLQNIKDLPLEDLL